MDQIFIGFINLGFKQIIMFAIGGLLIYLAVKKDYEPMLLLPIGFGTILVTLPLARVLSDEGAPGVLKI